MSFTNQESYASKIKHNAQDAASSIKQEINSVKQDVPKSLGWGSGLGYDGQQLHLRGATATGVGAEQDRFGGHFGLGEQNFKKIKEAMFRGISGAEQDRYAGSFGMGYDGKSRVKSLLQTKGVGAEQDRYEGHFGLSEEQVRKAKDAVARGLKQ